MPKRIHPVAHEASPSVADCLPVTCWTTSVEIALFAARENPVFREFLSLREFLDHAGSLPAQPCGEARQAGHTREVVIMSWRGEPPATPEILTNRHGIAEFLLEGPCPLCPFTLILVGLPSGR